MKHRQLDGITAIGIGEIQYRNENQYLTLVYQINLGTRRLLFVVKERKVKKLRRMGQDHVMSDERILGDSDVVDTVLSQAEEKYECHYEFKRQRYNLNRIAERVSGIYGTQAREIMSRGKQPQKVKARSPFYFWAVNELACGSDKWPRG